jgi:hypothetical protein
MFSERLPQVFNALFNNGEIRKKLLENEKPAIEGITSREITCLKQYFGRQVLAADTDGLISRIEPLDSWY